jgi:WD40 repeat protein
VTGNDLGKQAAVKAEAIQPHLAFVPNGATLISTHGNKLQLWDWTLAQPKVRTTLTSGGYVIVGLAISPDGRSLIVADNSGSIQVRDLATGAARTTLPLPKGTGIFSVASDGKAIAAACNDRLRVWDVDGTELQWPLRKPVGGALSWSVLYDPNSRLISANMNSIEVFSPTGRTVDAWKTPWQCSFGVLAADGRHLALATNPGPVIFRLPKK